MQHTISAGTILTSISSGSRVRAKVDMQVETVAPNVYRSTAGKLYTTKKVPGIATLERYSNDAVSRTPCNCRVEPDGECQHGVPNWLMIVGVI